MISNARREEEQRKELDALIEAEEALEAQRSSERGAMESEDPSPLTKGAARAAGSRTQKKIGSHLAPLPRSEALYRVEASYRSNNEPVPGWERPAAVVSLSG